MRKGICKNGHALKGENVIVKKNGDRECRCCRRVRDAKWRDRNRANLQEYQRIRDDARRRAGGVKARPSHRDGERGKRPDEPTWHRVLPSEPFINWLEHRLEETGYTHVEFGRRYWMDEKKVGDLMNGHQDTVHIDTVDKALIATGEMWALEAMYPLEGLRETKGYSRGERERMPA